MWKYIVGVYLIIGVALSTLSMWLSWDTQCKYDWWILIISWLIMVPVIGPLIIYYTIRDWGKSE